MSAQEILTAIKLKLATSAIVREVQIVQERALDGAGFFRARLRLINDDFVEVSEYFMIEGVKAVILEYRFQWMDSARQRLRKRWDNAAHYPQMDNFPHHIHIGESGMVVPGQALGIIDLLDILDGEIGSHSYNVLP
jgi:hypothetical protein